MVSVFKHAAHARRAAAWLPTCQASIHRQVGSCTASYVNSNEVRLRRLITLLWKQNFSAGYIPWLAGTPSHMQPPRFPTTAGHCMPTRPACLTFSGCANLRTPSQA